MTQYSDQNDGIYRAILGRNSNVYDHFDLNQELYVASREGNLEIVKVYSNGVRLIMLTPYKVLKKWDSITSFDFSLRKSINDPPMWIS